MFCNMICEFEPLSVDFFWFSYRHLLYLLFYSFQPCNFDLCTIWKMMIRGYYLLIFFFFCSIIFEGFRFIYCILFCILSMPIVSLDEKFILFANTKETKRDLTKREAYVTICICIEKHKMSPNTIGTRFNIFISKWQANHQIALVSFILFRKLNIFGMKVYFVVYFAIFQPIHKQWNVCCLRSIQIP